MDHQELTNGEVTDRKPRTAAAPEILLPDETSPLRPLQTQAQPAPPTTTVPVSRQDPGMRPVNHAPPENSRPHPNGAEPSGESPPLPSPDLIEALQNVGFEVAPRFDEKDQNPPPPAKNGRSFWRKLRRQDPIL